MKDGYVKILVKIIVLLATLVVMDIVVGWTGEKYMKWLNKVPRDGDAALVNYDLNAAIPDIAIIGSSTATCHYDPDIIHDSIMSFLGEDLSVFNMGMSNQRLAYDYYGLRCLLDRTLPKFVIVDVWASYLGSGDPSFSFSAYRPYVNINDNVKEMLVRHGKYDNTMKSNMYCFNTELVKLLISPLKQSNVNGFLKSKVEMNTIIKDYDKDTTSLLPLSVEEFDAILDLAKTKKFQLFVVLSPTLCSADTSSLSYRFMKSKCEENNIPFLDYSNDEKYYRTHYFRDQTHLNYYGAQLFTQELMKDIKPLLLNYWSVHNNTVDN